MSTRFRRLAIALGAIVVVLTACGGGGSGGTKIAGRSANDHGSQDVTGMTSLQINEKNFYFQPTVLKGTPGQHLTLTLKNSSGTDHNFTLDAQHVNKDINAGQTETVSVTFPSSGIVSFFCAFHEHEGMAGGLQVG
jgi:plastocyanin